MSIWHWMIVLLVVLLVFGAGKLPKVMGDLAKGIKQFKAGMKEEEAETPVSPPTVTTGAAQQTVTPPPHQTVNQPPASAPGAATTQPPASGSSVQPDPTRPTATAEVLPPGSPPRT